MSPQDSMPPDFKVRYSEQYQRRKHRKDTRTFLWGTWLMLLVAVGMGYETLQGFRTGEPVDIGADNIGLPVPWWLAALIVLGALLTSLWCFGRYARLRDTAPIYQPGDEEGSVDE